MCCGGVFEVLLYTLKATLISGWENASYFSDELKAFYLLVQFCAALIARLTSYVLLAWCLSIVDQTFKPYGLAIKKSRWIRVDQLVLQINIQIIAA